MKYLISIVLFFLFPCTIQPHALQVKIFDNLKAANKFKAHKVKKIEKIKAQELKEKKDKIKPKILKNRLRKTKVASEKLIYVVIPSYNNKDWYKKNLDSIMNQKYSNFHVMYIDDCSPDGTGKLVADYIKEKKWESRITLIQNTERCYSLANIYHAIHLCPNEAIIACCDGDDWYKDEHVLSLFNKVYQDQNIWITYGSFTDWPTDRPKVSKPFPKKVILKRDFRYYKWVCGQPRTFYAWLFKRIKKEDLMFKGEFFKAAGDRAIMNPLLEMAGHRFLFIPDILYIRNVATPLNDFKVAAKLQQFYSQIMLQQKKYPFLTKSDA